MAGNSPTDTHGGNGNPSALAGPREWAALAVLILPVILISVDMTVLGFAVPALSEALEPSAGQLLWIVDIYGFVLAGLLITMGSLGDRIGRRRLLMIGSTAFGMASLIAAFAPAPEVLIAARALLGLAGATLMPSTLSLLRNIFLDARQRLLAIAIWASGFSSGAALGPILGGWLLEHFFWGSVFLINLPVIALILVLGPMLLLESRNPDAGRMDPPSVLLSMGAMLPVVYGIKKVATDGLDVFPLTSLLLGLVVGWLFVRRQRRLEDPLIDVHLFGYRVFTIAVLTNLMIVFAMVGSLFFLTQYLQLVLGISPMRAGIVLLPGLLLSIVAGLIAARVARRLSLSMVIGVSLLVTASGFAIFAFTPVENVTLGVVLISTGFALIATGSGFAETLTNGAIMSAAPPKRAGAASAISETAYELGGAFGIAILGSILTGFYRGNLTDVEGISGSALETSRETLGGAVNAAEAVGEPAGSALMDAARVAFTDGMHLTSVIAAVLILFAAGQAWFSLRGQGNPAVENKQPEPEIVVHRKDAATGTDATTARERSTQGSIAVDAGEQRANNPASGSEADRKA